MFVLSEEVVSDLVVYNNLATSIQYVFIYIINSSLQVDTDVSRAHCDIGNMVVAYAIAICCINTSKVHMCLECHCSHIMYIMCICMYI